MTENHRLSPPYFISHESKWVIDTYERDFENL